MKNIIIRILENLDYTIKRMKRNLADPEDMYIGERHFYEILNHPQDWRLIEQTMQYLKDNPTIKRKEITLSDGFKTEVEIY